MRLFLCALFLFLLLLGGLIGLARGYTVTPVCIEARDLLVSEGDSRAEVRVGVLEAETGRPLEDVALRLRPVYGAGEGQIREFPPTDSSGWTSLQLSGLDGREARFEISILERPDLRPASPWPARATGERYAVVDVARLRAESSVLGVDLDAHLTRHELPSAPLRWRPPRPVRLHQLIRESAEGYERLVYLARARGRERQRIKYWLHLEGIGTAVLLVRDEDRDGGRWLGELNARFARMGVHFERRSLEQE